MMLVTVLLAILTAILGLYVWVRWTYRRLIRECEKLPSAYRRLPIIGSLSILVNFKGIGAVIMGYYTDKYAAKEWLNDANVIWAGPLPLIIINNKDDIRKVVSLSSEKADEVTNSLPGLAATGLLTAPVEHWKLTRRHVTPVFHPRNCSMLMPVFNRNARELVSMLSGHFDAGPVDISDHINSIALKSVLYLIYGPSFEMDLESPEFQRNLLATKLLPVMLTARVVNIFMRNDSIFNFVYRNEIKKCKKAKIDIIAAYEKCIKRKKEQSGGNDCIDNHTSTAQGHELTTMTDAYSDMMDTDPRITMNNYYDEVMTLMATGTDTVSSVLGFCLLALAQYPDMQEKLYTEVSDVVGLEEDLTVEDLPRLTYLDQLLKETMRRFMTVPLITRKILKDTKLSTYTVPAGTTVYLNLTSFNMNPVTFPDPLKFDPEHFSPLKSEHREKHSFVPFSIGARNCIGKPYADMFMKVAMVHLVRKFRVTAHLDMEQINLNYAIVISSADGDIVCLHSRD